MPQFCSFCGSAIGVQAPVVCANCGGEHWLKASPAAAALVVHDGRLLLTRRGHEPWLGRWCAPSGFCDGPEHPAQAAVRETFEEVGLTVRLTGYLGHWVDEYVPGRDDGTDPQYCAVSYYHAVPRHGVELRNQPGEVAEAAWFLPEELPADLAPSVSGTRIYAAWLGALREARLVTHLPEVQC